jgi:hypothetical protein
MEYLQAATLAVTLPEMRGAAPKEISLAET